MTGTMKSGLGYWQAGVNYMLGGPSRASRRLKQTGTSMGSVRLGTYAVTTEVMDSFAHGQCTTLAEIAIRSAITPRQF